MICKDGLHGGRQWLRLHKKLGYDAEYNKNYDKGNYTTLIV